MSTFLIAGQSYAANSHDKRLYVCDRRIMSYDMSLGRWVVADDPQPQSGGDAVVPGRIAEWGSIWPAFADAIQPAFTEPVRLITTSIYSEPLSFWLETPGALDRIVLGAQVAQGNAPILWQQGESDVIAHTSRATYVSQFRELRRRVAARTGYNLTWILALSTHHPTVYNDPAQENEIRAALMESAQDPDCLLGPDTDQLKGPTYRSPLGYSQHFTEAGQLAAAQMWRGSILAHMEHLMTDPQDKAAIAKLQASLSNLQNSFAALLEIAVSLQRAVGGIQQTIGATAGRINTLEPADTLEQLDPLGALEAQPFSFDA